ncbi:MAG: hypothetical protein OEU36_12065 [Gammaproteobacteria bacterium]|nr:hypothetical protein [Gammaproteobacteria bacterium]
MTQERRVERGFVALQGVAGTKEVPGGPYLLDRVEGQILSARRYWPGFSIISNIVLNRRDQSRIQSGPRCWPPNRIDLNSIRMQGGDAF